MFSKVKTQLFLEQFDEKIEQLTSNEGQSLDKVYLYPFTKSELQWLGNELSHPLAKQYFSQDELTLLQASLPNPDVGNQAIVEKGTLIADVTNRKSLQQLVEAILFSHQVKLKGFLYYPYRLRYSVRMNGWTLIAVSLHSKELQIVPLDEAINVEAVVPFTKNSESVKFSRLTEQLLQEQARQVRLVMNEESLHDSFEIEKARILNTFASYNKRIQKDKKNLKYYEIQVDYYLFEQEELLALIDQIGERVYVIGPEDVRALMKERILKTLQLYTE